MMQTDELHIWCALWRLPKIGAKRYAKILKVFGSPETFFSASRNSQEQAGIYIEHKHIPDAKKAAEKDIEWLTSHSDATLLTCSCCDYPKQLLDIADPPPVLFVRGNSQLLSAPQLAIVGSRSASHEGLENAKNFSQFLSQNGMVITSGLALGIDGAAHQGALSIATSQSGIGETIAVMGTGPDRVYPKQHHDLATDILNRGCIVTELPVGTPVVAHAFPRRNRIISGLSLGTLVVEASLKSGSLITARIALEQNKEVFAIPGSIHNPLARGCNHLIRNGAKLVETAKDIFEEIQVPLITFVEDEKSDTLEKDKQPLKVKKQSMDKHSHMHLKSSGSDIPSFLEDDSEKRQLWQSLSFDPQSVDVLVRRSGLSADRVSSMLLIFELGGQVIKQPGGRYQKKGE